MAPAACFVKIASSSRYQLGNFNPVMFAHPAPAEVRQPGNIRFWDMTFFRATALLAIMTIATPAFAFTPNTTPLSKSEKNIETIGTGVAIALPLVAGGITLLKHDRVGTAQLLVESALTVGTAFALKQIVKERRPNGSDYQSFPSDTTAIAASGSSTAFLMPS